MDRDDQIELALPASPEYGRVARIAAANLALRRGFSLREIDDLRLVMDEAVVMLLGPDSDADQLDICYSLDGDTVRIEATVISASDEPLPVEAVERFAELVGELVDEYTIDRARRQLVLSKATVAGG